MCGLQPEVIDGMKRLNQMWLDLAQKFSVYFEAFVVCHMIVWRVDEHLSTFRSVYLFLKQGFLLTVFILQNDCIYFERRLSFLLKKDCTRFVYLFTVDDFGFQVRINFWIDQPYSLTLK